VGSGRGRELRNESLLAENASVVREIDGKCFRCFLRENEIEPSRPLVLRWPFSRGVSRSTPIAHDHLGQVGPLRASSRRRERRLASRPRTVRAPTVRLRHDLAAPPSLLGRPRTSTTASAKSDLVAPFKRVSIVSGETRDRPKGASYARFWLPRSAPDCLVGRPRASVSRR
jgi:hypothetical protein